MINILGDYVPDHCHNCKKEYTERDHEHGTCHKCMEEIIEYYDGKE